MNVAAVQMQRGMDDCGLFTIAFALHAALGHCIEEIDFDQATMRNHLVKCFTARNFTPFTTKKVKRACSTRIINIDVFCTCQMPASYGDMVQCGVCELSRQMCWPSVTSIDCGGMELFAMLLINVGVPMNFTINSITVQLHK